MIMLRQILKNSWEKICFSFLFVSLFCLFVFSNANNSIFFKTLRLIIYLWEKENVATTAFIWIPHDSNSPWGDSGTTFFYLQVFSKAPSLTIYLYVFLKSPDEILCKYCTGKISG